MTMPSESESDSINTFEAIPDALVLLIFDHIADVKTLCCCAAVSHRLRSLSRQVHNAVVKLNRFISEDKPAKSSKSLHTCSHIFKIPNLIPENHSADRSRKANHNSAAQMLENFNEIKHLKIELQSPELELDNASFLKWTASFGSTLNNFVILAAASVLDHDVATIADSTTDPGIIPESFYTNGDLKSRVVWTISSLIAASTRHYFLHPIITEHKMLKNVTVNDMSRQGVLQMGEGQVEELRAILPSISCSADRTVMPDLEMRLWYAHRMELKDGSVLVRATLGAIRPREKVGPKEEFMEGDWVVSAFEEPFASAAKVIMKGRCYSVNIDSF